MLVVVRPQNSHISNEKGHILYAKNQRAAKYMSKNSITREFKNKISYKKAIIVVCIALLIIFIFLSSVASTNTRTNSSLENIDWGMSPDEVEYITKDFSRDTKFFKNGQRSVLIQRERIT